MTSTARTAAAAEWLDMPLTLDEDAVDVVDDDLDEPDVDEPDVDEPAEVVEPDVVEDVVEVVEGFTLDIAARSVLVICNACGWRHLAPRDKGDRPTGSAWRQARSHERRAHPGSSSATEAIAAAARRRNAVTAGGRPAVTSLHRGPVDEAAAE